MTLKPSTGVGSALRWSKSSYSAGNNNDCVEVAWVKSSYSSNDGPACVEVGWTKSSHSTNDGPECVEVKASDEEILVRDSKDPDGPRLSVTPHAWAAFLAYAASYEV
ncbi:DUF397 domain-containing protein [Streptomyces sp. NRRL F-5123]|uniref:DUF397 domain-containing protein n=1 Tax=Streptomyces sp. NRRL F-5123 TaxID=1463856 RepID=UPI0005BCC16A|nr:DUF397 domain-containing protein [Streptomyces sp. NRRL F-5123]